MAITGIIMADTVNITANNSPARIKPPPRNRATAVLTLALAALLLALGAPRLISAGLSLEARETLWTAYDNGAVTDKALSAAIDGLALARRWSDDGVADIQRGLLLTQRANNHPPGPERDQLYQDASKATEAGLALAPGDPSAWNRLAQLRRLTGNDDGAVAALRLSFLAGAMVPDLMVQRLDLAFALLSRMDAETMPLITRQIRLTWVIAPDFVANLSGRGHAALIQEALASLGQEEMEQYLHLHHPRP